MSKGYRIFIRILAIVLMVMSLILMIVKPLVGICGIAFGILLLIYTIKAKDKPYYSKYTFSVAGLPYYRENYENINPDNEFPIQLIEEPDNPYDPNAIKVMMGKYHIGHVPADECNKVKEIISTREIMKIYYNADWDEEEWYSVEITIMYKGEEI